VQVSENNMNNLLKGLNVYLIGMMGSGKTTVGKLLAEKLKYRFLDTDFLIENVTQKTINQIFAEDGEMYFRELESKILAEVSTYTRSVVATGGGIILKSENWSYLHHGMIIWLDTPVELILQRLADDQTRPLLQKGDLLDKLTNLIAQRKSFYQQADLTIPIQSERTPEEIIEQIIQLIPSKLKPALDANLN
jgi:shikimate kinase